jgi:hypothetical protein
MDLDMCHQLLFISYSIVPLLMMLNAKGLATMLFGSLPWIASTYRDHQ